MSENQFDNQETSDEGRLSPRQRIEGELADARRTRNIQVTKLGEKIYTEYREKPSGDSEIDLLVGTIRQADKKIASLREQMNQIDGMRTCPSCGARIPMASQFCSVCGSKLPPLEGLRNCPRCGKPLQPGDKFCINCGFQVRTTASGGNEPSGDSEAKPAGTEETAAAMPASEKTPASADNKPNKPDEQPDAVNSDSDQQPETPAPEETAVPEAPADDYQPEAVKDDWKPVETGRTDACRPEVVSEKDDYKPELSSSSGPDEPFVGIPVGEKPEETIRPEAEKAPGTSTAHADEVSDSSNAAAFAAAAPDAKAETEPEFIGAPDVCPVCGAIVPYGHEFCSSCGCRIIVKGEKKPFPGASLTMKMGNYRFSVDRPEFLIGSDQGNLRITDSHISKNHAEILYVNGDFFLKDLKSAEGTFLNGRKVLPERPEKLKDGDLVSFSDIEAVFRIGK